MNTTTETLPSGTAGPGEEEGRHADRPAGDLRSRPPQGPLPREPGVRARTARPVVLARFTVTRRQAVRSARPVVLARFDVTMRQAGTTPSSEPASA
ncbi:hypothetical protein ACFFQW_25225 [Umezawaea endophytica]|uniref:Uncharacterized protein n=1 Tax=Umezawaea endophytica TaxID=1654476 RepID=A0A9X2VMV2_9PSEU|nr:hypothetical protein [Umezawaea endophytica]MCS7479426.1 hypothetical protein [Umezawaea endophytica]